MRNTISLVLSLFCLFFLAGVSGYSQDICNNNEIHCIERPVCWGSKPFADYAQIERGDVLVLDIKKTCCDRVKGEVDDPGGIGWQGGGASKSVRFLTRVPRDKSGYHMGKMSGIMLGCQGNDEKSRNSRTEWKARAFAEVCNKDLCEVYKDPCAEEGKGSYPCFAYNFCKNVARCDDVQNCIRKCLVLDYKDCKRKYGNDGPLLRTCVGVSHQICYTKCGASEGLPDVLPD